MESESQEKEIVVFDLLTLLQWCKDLPSHLEGLEYLVEVVQLSAK